tara:strand:+ start:1622 stop:1954 length:333 start_codon:yes stop_codon:yes gene_type:complete
MKIKKSNRLFTAGITKLKIIDKGSIYLKDDNQVTFRYKKSEYDVCRKNWGYYATPSINGRLQNFGFKTFLTQNKFKKIYINLVHSNKMKTFKKYLKKEKSKILIELTNFK